MRRATIIERARISYVGRLRRAAKRGDYLRTVVPDAGVSVAGKVLYQGRVIGTYTMLGAGIVNRKGYSVPADDRDAIADFFRRASAA